MTGEHPGFRDYLSRHYAHLGDQSRHRAAKKQQLLLTYGPLLPASRDAAMLEIGPGFGQLLEALRLDRGYGQAVAIDLSHEVVEFCNERMPGSTTYVEDTGAWLRAHAGRFERIFLLHVLEHVPIGEVDALLRDVREALAPAGSVVIELPNMANVFTGNYLRWADRTHEWGGTEQSLRQLLESAGFQDVRCFEERIPAREVKGALAGLFRALARVVQIAIYRGYELPVPRVLTPALCVTAVRAVQSP